MLRAAAAIYLITGVASPAIAGETKIIYGKDHVFRGGSHGSTLRIAPEEKFKEIRKSLPDWEKKAPDHDCRDSAYRVGLEELLMAAVAGH